MIRIKKSPDCTKCNSSQFSKEDLLVSTKNHIKDVRYGLYWFCSKLLQAAKKHDFTKIQNIDLFYKDFINNFQIGDWYKFHQQKQRHHITSQLGLRDDIDLVDVIQFLIDGVMSGLARREKYEYQEISNELLQKAFYNTIKKLISNVQVNN